MCELNQYDRRTSRTDIGRQFELVGEVLVLFALRVKWERHSTVIRRTKSTFDLRNYVAIVVVTSH